MPTCAFNGGHDNETPATLELRLHIQPTKDRGIEVRLARLDE